MSHHSSDETVAKKNFKDTLNLPRTDFPIRSNAKVDDPAMIERWIEQNLYEQAFKAHEHNEKFILHDGPPYANGHIHLGGSFNKILKDIICKAQRMFGKHVPVTPGWDCHGLPIELKVTKEFSGLSAQALKKQCRAYAQQWVEIQKEEFRRLGVLMDWDNPYLTMSPSYEAATVRAFGKCVEEGYIHKKNKTVPWCASCQTVLATAEIEYADRKDPSIYVLFSLLPETIAHRMPDLKGHKVSFLVWTTTPWTLPLNRAVMLNPQATYAVLKVNDQYVIVGKPLVEKIAALLQVEPIIVQELSASDFAHVRVEHPIIEQFQVPVVFDASVSLEDGTACVHCAPGCGPEDYEVGLRNNLEIYSPISPAGTYTKGIEPHVLQDMSVSDGQIWVLRKLQERNTLLHKTSVKHNYPHCWRCRNGLIFRATKQWFLNLSHDGLREKALKAIESITFIPKRSRGFLQATISGRLEWCLSRQRTWGVPIPALLCTQCEHAYTTPEFIESIARGVEQYGIEYWDDVQVKDIMPAHLTCAQCLSTSFKKECDILDVWFDSGVSHYAVLHNNKDLGYPADMYLEGVDQHRGWFQSSLLMSMVLEKKPSMKIIATHGYTVDEKGHKMSKSLGNVVTPDEIVQKIGTDGLRLWASSIDFSSDPIVSAALLQNIAEVYRRIRNTARFLLSNLYDFDIDTDAVPLERMFVIDRYALERLFHLNLEIQAAYENVDFTSVFHQLADYCTKDLSAFYLDVVKDRLYVEKADGVARRSAQTACWYILDTLTKLMAPILSFVAEQVSDCYQKDKKHSIHLQTFNQLKDVWTMIARQSEEHGHDLINWYPYKAPLIDVVNQIHEMVFHKEREKQWTILNTIRSAVLKKLENLREQGEVKHSLDAQVTLCIEHTGPYAKTIKKFLHDVQQAGQSAEGFFKEFFIVSQCSFVSHSAELEQLSQVKDVWLTVKRADGNKCPRCWQWHVSKFKDDLCERCASVLNC